MNTKTLSIHSIFQSINGEVSAPGQGSLCTFIRLQGCNLRCSYCDTSDSQEFGRGAKGTVEDIITMIRGFPIPTRNITITGGEPLIQKEALLNLVSNLHKRGYYITIETNGTQKLYGELVQKCASIVMDIKSEEIKNASADSFFFKEKDKNSILRGNIICLRKQDWINFPMQTKENFDQALLYTSFIRAVKELPNIGIAFSPIVPFTAKKIFSLIKENNEAGITINIQLHKLVNLE